MTREAKRWGFVLAGFSALLALHPIRGTDPFWRLDQGRAILQHRARIIPEFSAFHDFSDPVVAPQWLWDVGTFLIYQAGSWLALAIFLCLLTFAVVYTVVCLVDASSPLRSRSALVLVSTLTVCIVMARIQLRPQTVSMLLVPGFLLLLYSYRLADGRRRRLLGVVLLAVEILWAQLHGSFVLAPALFAIVVGIHTLSHRRELWPEDFIMLQALVVGLLSSAHGVEIFSYITSHGGGYATQFIREMTAPTWASFNPAGSIYAPIYLLMCLLTAAAMIRARQIWWNELALAGFGFVLGMTAIRFFAIGAILLAPLAARAVSAAMETASETHLWRALRTSMVVVSLLLLVVVAHEKATHRGPIPGMGPASGHHPQAAARYLLEKAGAENWNVLTHYDITGQLGFWFDGALRTYIDSRTPAYFDDSDFGLAQEIWRDPSALGRGLARYDAQAAVALRNSPMCQHLAASWDAVVVEPRTTAFVQPGLGEPLTHLVSCGPIFLSSDACDDDARSLDAEIDRMARLGETPFVDYLRAERIVQCGGDLDRVPALIPTDDEAFDFKPARNRLVAAYHYRRGDEAAALEAVADDIMAGNAAAYTWAADLLARSAATSLERRREILEALVSAVDDIAPPGVRTILAHVCASMGDAECTRFYALRAAARGEPGAISSLKWLTRNHPSDRARREANRWHEILLTEGES